MKKRRVTTAKLKELDERRKARFSELQDAVLVSATEKTAAEELETLLREIGIKARKFSEAQFFYDTAKGESKWVLVCRIQTRQEALDMVNGALTMAGRKPVSMKTFEKWITHPETRGYLSAAGKLEWRSLEDIQALCAEIKASPARARKLSAKAEPPPQGGELGETLELLAERIADIVYARLKKDLPKLLKP